VNAWDSQRQEARRYSGGSPAARYPLEGMRSGPQQWFFDAWSLVYDLPPVQRAVYRPPHDAVLAALRTMRHDRVLDVGCGTGLLAARMRCELAGTQVVGCDFSAGMLRRARVRDARIPWVQGDAGCLPFCDGAFDVVVSTEAFHWFPDPVGALREMRRVLSPGGRLLLGLVNPRFALTGWAVGLVAGWLGEPFRWPTRRELWTELRGAGFRVDTHTRVLRFPGLVLLPAVLTSATVADDAGRARMPRARRRPPIRDRQRAHGGRP
jgi:SAM-dependent methyltransferase